ncbi:MAG TPA: extracellular solute-binding protein [Candidatus Limnocylindria bacterium]
MRSTVLRFVSFFAILALVLAACSSSGGSSQEPEGSEPAGSEPAASEGGTGEVVEIRWFCCLGAGDDAETQVPTEEAVVAAFNESHDDIELVLEVVDYDSAYDALAVQIAGGNAPDILGPVGGTGAAAFEGQWLDLTEQIEATNHDLTQYSEGSVEFYQVEGQGQVGLPFAIFPSMLFYQRSMFDEADLEYPPQTYGDPYVLDGEEVEWNFDTLREVAKRLTVDVNGNDATSADFDETQIEQYGYDPIFQDARAIGSYFGAGSLVADDETTAQIPDEWREAWTWHYENIWEEHITMDIALRDAPEFGNGNPFNALRAAMALSHTWYTCCANAVDDDGVPIDPDWDVAVVPSHNGVTTANFNADTFRIWGETEHPAEAFEVLTYLIGEKSLDLLGIYGGMPARTADQDQFFADLDERWTQGVNWQVARDGVEYADNPSFEAWMPNYQEAFASVVTFGDTMRTDGTLDIQATIDDFQEELQAIFDSAE